MAYVAVPTVATGDLWTASNQNTYLRDNMAALFPYSAAGDIGVASAADMLGRLAAPASARQGIVSDPAEALKMAWQHILPVMDYVTVANVSTSSTTMVDMTGATITLTLEAVSTVMLIAAGYGYAVGHTYYIQGLIDGVSNYRWSAIKTVDICDIPIALVYLRTGVAAGNRVVKLQHKVSSGSSQVNYMNMIALAFPE